MDKECPEPEVFSEPRKEQLKSSDQHMDSLTKINMLLNGSVDFVKQSSMI